MTDYFKIEGAPGRYFRCTPYGASMSPSGCAGMYAAEKGNRDGRHHHCNGCKVGACHSGEVLTESSCIYGSKLCPRCARPASRIVRGLCVSCLNRQYEVEKGRNAKGSRPVHLPDLHPCMLQVSVEKQVKLVRFEQTAGMVEGIYRVLRSQPGDPVFGWVVPKPRLVQRSLFDLPGS